MYPLGTDLQNAEASGSRDWQLRAAPKQEARFTEDVMCNKTRSGFTLIELLVVIAIIAILAAILFPIFTKAKMAAKRSACMNNMKQLSVAAQVYADHYNGNYPPNRLAHWPWGTWLVPYTVYTVAEPHIGMRGLVPYVKNQDVFCCPNNLIFGESRNWGPGTNWYAGYCYWGNYTGSEAASGATSPLTPKQVAQNTGHDPYSVLISDIVVTYDNGTSDGAKHPWNSHPMSGLPEGGNFVYNDGHAKWKWRQNMRFQDSFLKITTRFWF